MAIRVHLADDHTMFREGLESILASRGGGGIEVVGRSSTGGEEALALIEENKPDVVIAQIDADLNTAREVLLRIRSCSPDSRIVVLTMFDNLHYLKALSKLGIHAYIHKSSSSKDLLATIDAASREPAGENVVVSMPRALLERMGEEPVGSLSERETEIVVLAARGLIGKASQPVKVLGSGELSRNVTVSAHAFSRSAREKIEGAGGSVQEIA